MILQINFAIINDIDQAIDINEYYNNFSDCIKNDQKNLKNVIIGNIYQIEKKFKEMENSLSSIMQILQCLAIQSDSIRQCLIIVNIQNEKYQLNNTKYLQSKIQDHSNNKSQYPQQGSKDLKNDSFQLVIDAINCCELENQDTKINVRIKKNHRICTTLPVTACYNKLEKQAKSLITVANSQDKLWGNYLYYLALSEGFTRNIQSLLINICDNLVVQENIQIILKLVKSLFHELQQQQQQIQ